MMLRRLLIAAAALAALLWTGGRLGFDVPGLAAQPSSPVIVVETSRGPFAIELFPKDAPLSTAHILGLVNASFYDGQRVHRALPGFVVQFGDPQTRDPGKQEVWGRGAAASSGKPIGVAEVNYKRKHVALSVGLAHMGEPAQADSQLYVTLAPRPDLDGQYVIVGQVIEGRDIPALLQVGDEIRRVYIRE